MLGATIAARAAAELHTGAGINSMTITRLLGQLDEGKVLPRGGVVVIDEAGMVGTRQLARLVDAANERDTKIVLVGDPRQLPEIEAGGILNALATRIPVHTLTENRRQREPWERSALREFRNGDVTKALDALDNHGRIERVATLTDVHARIVDDWATARGNGEEAIMLAARRDDVRALNQQARTRLTEKLVGPTMVIDGAAFQAGDTIMTLRNNKRLGVRNGERGTLTAINPDDRSITVRMNGRALELPSSYLDAGHLAHGYAMTVHKAQGLTVDRAFVLGTDDLYREMGYVAMSRGRNANHLYIVAEPTRPEIEPTHAPTLERTTEELLTTALTTSKAQTLAVTQLDPLAATPDADLAAEYRTLVAYQRSIPADASHRLSQLRDAINDHDHTIATLQQQQQEARAQRRPIRDVMAGRDDRGRQQNYRIASTRRFRGQLLPEHDRLTADQERRRKKARGPP